MRQLVLAALVLFYLQLMKPANDLKIYFGLPGSSVCSTGGSDLPLLRI